MPLVGDELDSRATNFVESCLEKFRAISDECLVEISNVKQDNRENNFVAWNKLENDFNVNTRFIKGTGEVKCSLDDLGTIKPVVNYGNCKPLKWTPDYPDVQLIQDMPFKVQGNFKAQCQSYPENKAKKEIEICPTQDIELGTINMHVVVDLVEAQIVNNQVKSEKVKIDEVSKAFSNINSVKFKFVSEKKILSPVFGASISFQKKS